MAARAVADYLAAVRTEIAAYSAARHLVAARIVAHHLAVYFVAPSGLVH